MAFPPTLRLPFQSRLREPLPLMLATQSRLRVASRARPAGYQPVGIEPRSLLFPGTKSITAIALLVPLEAKTVFPSRLIARALGALPKRRFSAGRVEMVSTT